jgi:nucleoid-associated protein YgaU
MGAGAVFNGSQSAGAVIGGLMGGLIGQQIALPNNKVYTIQPGDNLTSIAKSQLGDNVNGNDLEKYMNKILDMNEDVIQNPHMLYKGDTIALPAAPAQGQAKQVQQFLD